MDCSRRFLRAKQFAQLAISGSQRIGKLNGCALERAGRRVGKSAAVISAWSFMAKIS